MERLQPQEEAGDERLGSRGSRGSRGSLGKPRSLRRLGVLELLDMSKSSRKQAFKNACFLEPPLRFLTLVDSKRAFLNARLLKPRLQCSLYTGS
jgi:hypothetical protein